MEPNDVNLADPPIDLKAAMARVMGDGAFIKTLIEEFLGDVADQLEGLRAAVDAADVVAMRQQAHRLKGAAANLGAAGVAQAALCLEGIGREARLEQSEKAWQRLVDEVARLKDYIAQVDWAQLT